MPVKQRIGALAETLLKQRLANQQQQKQADSANQFRILDAGLNDKSGDLFSKLQKAGLTNIGGMDINALAPTQEDALAPIGASIAKESDPTKLPDPMSILAQAKAAPGFKYDQSSRQPIEQLINQVNQRRESINNSAPLVKQSFVDETGPFAVQKERYVNPNHAGEVQTELSGPQVGANKLAEFNANEGSLGRQRTEARGAGMKTGAEHAAAFPWEEKLAQERLKNQQTMLDYKNQHPSLSPIGRQRADAAIDGLDRVSEVRQLALEMDKAGMMGPVMGVIAKSQGDLNTAARVIANMAGGTPEQKRLAGEFVNSLGTLQSLMAVVHGGARGGSSVQLMKHMQAIMNGSTDINFFQGELDGLESLMSTYAKYPERYLEASRSGQPGQEFDLPPALRAETPIEKESPNVGGTKGSLVGDILTRKPRTN